LHHGYWTRGDETKEKANSTQVRGITISPVQVRTANQAAAEAKANAKFLLMDAEEMKFDESFDVIWSVESIAHLPRRQKFFAAAAHLLKPNGTLAIIDWFKKDNLTRSEYQEIIQPIERGMLVVLRTMRDYETSKRSSRPKTVDANIRRPLY